MNKTVLITGASCGIGRETAMQFSYSGYNVIINYFNSKNEAENLQKKLENECGRAMAIRADVSNINEVKAMIRQAEEAFGKIDVLVNNAGIAMQKLITYTTDEEWRRIFAINVDGTFYCSQAVLPSMLNKHSGKIINISSIWGLCGASCEVAYSAAKAAIVGFTKALAKEVAPSNVQVNCIAPGVINSKMNASFDIDEIKKEIPIGRIGTTKEVADIILFLASEKADFITGQIISPNGGMVI